MAISVTGFIQHIRCGPRKVPGSCCGYNSCGVMRLFVAVLGIGSAFGQYNVLTFHGDRQRTGWISVEKTLTPASVASGFGPVWNSPPLDSVTILGTTYPPHLYASPLYVDRVTMTGGAY